MLLSILLLVSIQHLHGLICYSNGTFSFSRNEFNWNNFSSILNNIENQIISNTSSCHVRITTDYNNKNNNNKNYVIIKFDSSILPYSNPNIEFGSTLNFHENQIQSIISYLDYRCLSGNLCDKIFLKKWAKQLLNASDNSLHNNFLSLWKNSNICHSKILTNQCASYVCFTISNELKNLSDGKFSCEDKSINIYIKTYSGRNKNEYQCIKNDCTQEVLYNSMKEKNLIENLLNNEYQINQVILKRSIIIVGILLFIGFIAYYIQCQQYKQGYKLTVNA